MDILEASTVNGKDGLFGTIENISRPSQDKPAQVLIRLANGQKLLVPIAALSLREDGTYSMPLSLADVEHYRQQSDASDEVVIVPVIAEELDIQKRTVETGKVRVTKVVHEQEELVDEPLLQEKVEVERIPINQFIDSPVATRYEGETMIIPLVEEVLVIEKRLMLREEVRITKHQIETRDPQRVVRRQEEARIERQDESA